MKRTLWVILSGLLIGGSLNACQPSQAELDGRATQIAANVYATQTAQAPTATPTSTTTPTVTPTPKPSSTPTTTLTPTPTPTPTPLAPADIFARVSPSIAFIETPKGTGSGVLIEDGYLITNAHVVWPFQKARVVFPDGSEFLDSPVLNWDLMSDVAVIGPLKTSIAPLSFVDGEQQVIGSDVYLIGYPGEVEQFPQPTITRGLISRLREWEALGITYFQTDATIAGGQSGGVLVSKRGEVIGVSGFAFTEAGFGMVASATDILPRIQKLIAGEDVAGLGNRLLPLENGQLEHDFTLQHEWDSSVYIINEPVRTKIDLTVKGENDALLALEDLAGQMLIAADDAETGAESGSATTEWAVPHFVVVGQTSAAPGDFHLSSNHKLVAYEDLDDNTSVSINQSYLGSIDYPGDFDYYTLELEEGELVNIAIDSVVIDPVLRVGYLGASDEQLVLDDNSGGGLFGTDAELTYQAPSNGIYFISVEDWTGYRVGGYTLQLSPPPPGATPVAPPPTPTPTPKPTPPPAPTLVPAPATPLTSYQSAQFPFTIHFPAEWAEQPRLESDPVQYDGGNASLVIVEEDLVAEGAGEMTQDDYVDLVLFALPQYVENFELISSQRMVNAQGIPFQVIVFTAGPNGILKFSRLIYLHNNKIGFNATYYSLKTKHQELEPLIAYSFSTFQVTQ